MALESASLFIGDEMRMQTWTELLQIHGVTTIRSHSHVGSQTLNDVCHRLVDVLLWQFFSRGSASAFNSRVVLGFGWSLLYFSSM